MRANPDMPDRMAERSYLDVSIKLNSSLQTAVHISHTVAINSKIDAQQGSATGIACKRGRKLKCTLLQLPLHVLDRITNLVMQPAETAGMSIVTGSSLQRGLSLAMACRKLYASRQRLMQNLELGVCKRLTERGLMAICRRDGDGIIRLGLRSCSQIGIECIGGIGDFCTNLRAIDLSFDNVNHITMIRIVFANHHSLEKIVVHKCVWLTDRTIVYIGTRCTKLHYLDIGCIPGVTDVALESLVRRRAHTLRTLVISKCIKLTDVTFANIGLHCHRLTSLTARELLWVTDFGLLQLCVGIGRDLNVLDVVDCGGISLSTYVNVVQTYCPNILHTLERSHLRRFLGARCLRDTIISANPNNIMVLSAVDARSGDRSQYVMLLDQSSLYPFQVAVCSHSLNLGDFGTVILHEYGSAPSRETEQTVLNRFGWSITSLPSATVTAFNS